MYGPAPAVGRVVTSDVDFGNGFIVKTDKSMPINFLLQCSAAMDSTQKDPDNFRPERFLSGEANSADFSFAPFSRGVRDCIGQPMANISIKLQLIHIYKNFSTEVVVKTADDELINRPQELQFLKVMKTQPVCRFTKRNQ